MSISKALGSGTNGSAANVSVRLTSLTPLYIEQLREMVPPPSQNTVAVCNQITLFILCYISSRLVTLLKIIDALYKSLIFFRFINFNFQISLLFVPEMSTSFKSYIV